MNKNYYVASLGLFRNRYLSRTWIVMLLSIFGLFGAHVAQAAPIISYTLAKSIIKGYGQDTLKVKVTFDASCTGTQIRVGMPAGVTYVAGSVGLVATSTAGLTMTESNITNLRSPIFSVGGTIATGNNVEFYLLRRADCAAVQGGGFDSVYVSFGGGCTAVSMIDPSNAAAKNYNIYAPALSQIPPPAINNAFVGSMATRLDTVINGGSNSAIDTLRFYIVYPNGSVMNTAAGNAITANGVTFTSSSANGDTLFYKIFGSTIFGGNNLFENGEKVAISEPIKVLKCNSSTTYGAGWGRAQTNVCNWNTATSAVTMATGSVVLSTTVTDSVLTKPCSPGIIKITLTNNGNGGNAGAIYNVVANLGSATPNIPGTIFSATGPDNPSQAMTYSNFRINGNLIGSVTASSGAQPWIMNAAQFTTDPDGVGVGLDDLDGDGQYDDLAPGKSITITMTRTYNFQPNCVRPTYYLQSAVKFNYQNMCSDSFVSVPKLGGGQWQSYITAINKTLPTLVAGGQPFTIRICDQGFHSTAPNQIPVDSIKLRLTLPPGLSYVSNTAQFTGTTAGVVQNGNILTLSGKRNGLFCFQGDFVYACGTSGTLKIPYQITWVLDTSCPAVEYLQCDSLQIAVKCSAPCSYIGNMAPSAQRVNYSWTTPQKTASATASTVPLLSTKSLLPYDTLRLIQPAKMGTNSANSLYYDYELNKAGGSDVLSFVSGTVNFIASGTSTIRTCAMPSITTDSSTATLTKWIWNLTPLMNNTCLPVTLNTGDSVWVDLKYSVTTANSSNLYATSLTSPPNQASYFYNKDNASKDYCDVWAPDFYLLGIAISGTSTYNHLSGVTLQGCNSADVSAQNYNGQDGEAGDAFPGEYRPFSVVDSIKWELPTGIVWGNYSSIVPSTFGATAYSPVPTTIDLTANTTYNNNIVTVVPPSSAWFDDLLPTSYVTRNRTYIRVFPSCAAADTNLIKLTSYVRTYAYAGLNISKVSSYTGNKTDGLSLYYGIANRTSVNVINNSGIVQGISPSQYWDISLANSSSQSASNVWFALERSASSGVIIDSVKARTGTSIGAIIPVESTYGSTFNKWYKAVPNSITNGGTEQYRVYFHYTSCSPDSILLKAGWDCSTYLTNPSAYPCNAASTYLKVIPQPSQIQLSVMRQPGGGSAINLCTTDSTIIIVNSAQSANLTSPKLTFIPPAGITIPSTIKVEYPLGSGNYQSVPVTFASGTYTIDLSAHTGIAMEGILGTVLATSTNQRQAKIKLDFNASCDFASGTSFKFNGYGNLPCGQPSIGNGVSVTTDALNISGATTTGGASMTLSFGAATTATCGNPLTLTSTVTPLVDPSVTTDTLVYTLPVGIVYAGGLTPTTYTAVQSGNTVKIGMIASAASTSVNLSFNVQASGATCGKDVISATYNRKIAGLMCGATPCTNASKVIASALSDSIGIVKPTLAITNVVAGPPEAYAPGGTYNAAIAVSNTSGANAPASTYRIEAYCGTSTTPFSTQFIPVAIPADSTKTFTLSFTANGSTCVNGALVTYKINTVTATNITQCLCSPSSFASIYALPVNFSYFEAQKQNRTSVLTWGTASETNNKGFGIERSDDGITWHELGFVNAQTPTGNSSSLLDYRYIDANPMNGKNFYRLAQTNFDGGRELTSTRLLVFGSSKGLIIYPNPTNDVVYIDGLEGTTELSLITIDGKVLQTLNTSDVKLKLDLSNYANGIYVLAIRDANGLTSHHKVVKK